MITGNEQLWVPVPAIDNTNDVQFDRRSLQELAAQVLPNRKARRDYKYKRNPSRGHVPPVRVRG